MDKARGNWDGGRIELIDALRGLSLVLMVLHHLLFDLSMFGMFPGWFLISWPIYVLHVIFASVFILLSGVSSRFSRSNVRRGLKTWGCALAVTLVTWAVGMPAWWGILHLLGFCMILYGLISRWLDKMPERLGMALYLVLFLVLAVTILDRPFDVKGLSILGIMNRDFLSSDYFPIFPWVLMFLFGTCFGRMVEEGRLPRKFYEFDMPVLPEIGRKSLWIYMLHQPVLYGVTWLIARIIS
jgi:uncharacterized membrane protein